MSGHSILIYGGGNCEMASSLDDCLSQIEQINDKNLKVFARGYLFDNSCLAMYGRFEAIKDRMKANPKQASPGGVHEYFYDGNQIVKTCELKMQPVSKTNLEAFLRRGIEKMQDTEMILILIGQGDLESMFLDFSSTPPTALSYKEVFESIDDVLKDKIKKLHLIMDFSNWHDVYLPKILAQYTYIDTIFIYERKDALEVFPLAVWANTVFNKEGHWSEITMISLAGYKIDPHPIWWQLCEKRWEEYVVFPSSNTWEAFYSVYKKLVIHNGKSKRLYSSTLRKKSSEYAGKDTISFVQEYLKREYGSDIEEKEIEKWLESLKICTDYYKL